MLGCRPLNQPLRQPELCTQLALPPLHAAFIGFMVEASQMQQSMKNQNPQLNSKRVPLFGCLASSRLHANRHIASDFFLALEQIGGGEGKHVGRFIFAAEAPVQISDRRVSRKKYRYLAAESDSVLSLREVPAQRARGRNAKILPLSGRSRSLCIGGCQC